MCSFEEFSRIFHTVMSLNDLSEFCTEDNIRRFYQLTDHMLTVNESMNLTAIKDVAEIILLHYADSLQAAKFLPKNARIADIGCGAGFPCLPLAICRPDLSILALDSTEKRIRYVDETAKLLGCDGIEAVAMRAEDGGKGGFREQFDVCTARAVAALPALTELCLPFVRVDGTFLAMKGKRGEEELEAAKGAIGKLGGRLVSNHTLTLHRENGEDEARALIEIKKVSSTPSAYPRAWGKILKKPL